ncbi:hypothetical protein ISG29_10205 [Nocardioides sp. CBS4Y-1]|uniref:LVIVD repeat-containing protein n=1 Tax=Nocardioides acrostichi TaxID=2784339 RepID=A0A930Y683_9ACTN|nr:hypothetical protein [Nocardioides acrostichi]
MTLTLLAAGALVAGAMSLGGTTSVAGTDPSGPGTAVPRAHCGPGSRPETSIQGRVPQRDYDTGRAAKGYTCNTRQLAHHGSTGGFKVQRYTDAAGRTCAYYDSTLLFPTDVVGNLTTGQGVIVLDMTHPRRPRQTATLTSPAMLSPHESLLVNRRRGLLAGTLGNPATAPGILDVYDLRQDCRHPELLSSTPSALLGHESGWSRDGKTFYTASTVATLVGIDLSDPTTPQVLFAQAGVNYHGLRLSPDGNTLYAAHIGEPGPTGVADGGLAILDVSDVQARVPGAEPTVLSKLTWPNHSIPQVAEPFKRGGRDYVFEIDEFVDFFELTGIAQYPGSAVGVARIIDVTDAHRPKVVSDIHLQVHETQRRTGAQKNDPGAASPAQGYAGHYCSLPTHRRPKVAGCSMILSGLRLIDIRDVHHPREVAYFNQPMVPGSTPKPVSDGGAYAMSAPAYDRKRGQVWYTDANSGFYNVKLTNGVAKLLR